MSIRDSIAPRTAGTLFVVATPIGNLGDLGARAREIMRTADLLLAEDTRHTGQMLRTLGIERALESLHEHNERARSAAIVERLLRGESVALVSDAGTPLVSDPGAVLVAAAVAAGCVVSTVPGPCAAIAALSVAALPLQGFAFEGFAPPKSAARRAWLALRAQEPRTTVYYEAPHRIAGTLADMCTVFGAGRQAAVARELTKQFESVYRGTLEELAARASADADMSRGELVIVVHGAPQRERDATDEETLRVLRILLAELPTAQAAKLAAQITGRARRDIYERAVELAAIR